MLIIHIAAAIACLLAGLDAQDVYIEAGFMALGIINLYCAIVGVFEGES